MLLLQIVIYYISMFDLHSLDSVSEVRGCSESAHRLIQYLSAL